MGNRHEGLVFFFLQKKKFQLYAFQSQETSGNLKRQRVFFFGCCCFLCFCTPCAKLKLIAFWTPLTDIPRESVQLNGLAVGNSTLFFHPFFNQQCGYCLHSSFSPKIASIDWVITKKKAMWNISVPDHILMLQIYCTVNNGLALYLVV